MARTDKHHAFLKDAMVAEVETPVTKVPGIGPAIGKRLKRAGITTAMALYGCYLSDKRDFKYVIEEYGGNTKHQEDAYRAMKQWDERN